MKGNNYVSRVIKNKNLEVVYKTDRGTAHVLNNISFSINKGETLGLVGKPEQERLLQLFQLCVCCLKTGFIKDGEIIFDGKIS